MQHQGSASLFTCAEQVLWADGAELTVRTLHSTARDDVRTWLLNDGFTYVSSSRGENDPFKMRLLAQPDHVLLDLGQAMNHLNMWKLGLFTRAVDCAFTTLDLEHAQELISIHTPPMDPPTEHSEISIRKTRVEPRSMARFVLFSAPTSSSRFHSFTIKKFCKRLQQGQCVMLPSRRKLEHWPSALHPSQGQADQQDKPQEIWERGIGIVVRVSQKSGSVTLFFPEPSFGPPGQDQVSQIDSKATGAKVKGGKYTPQSTVFDLRDAGQVDTLSLPVFLERCEEYTRSDMKGNYLARSSRNSVICSRMSGDMGGPVKLTRPPMSKQKKVVHCWAKYGPMYRIQPPGTTQTYWVHESSFRFGYT